VPAIRYVTVAEPEQERLLVEHVVAVAVNAGVSEVADTAFASVTAYLMQMPDMCLAPIVAIFFTALSNHSFSRGECNDYDGVLAGFRYLNRLLLLYLDHLEHSGRPCAVSASAWMQARQLGESVAIMWMVHSDPAVRATVLEVLRTFSHPVFVGIEEARHGGPEPVVRLAALLDARDDASAGMWCVHLDKLLAHRPAQPPKPPESDESERCHERIVNSKEAADPPKSALPQVVRFRAHLEFAWIRLVQRFNDALVHVLELNAERLRLWLNYTRFLCLAMSSSQESGGQSEAKLDQPTERVRPQDLDEFYTNLLRIAWNPIVPLALRNQLLGYLEQLHPSCIERAVRIIQSLRQDPPPVLRGRFGRKKPTANAEVTQMREVAWIFHEEVLEMLTRFMTRMMTIADDEASEDRPGAESGVDRLGERGGREVEHSPALPRALIQALQCCISRWVHDFDTYGPESCRELSIGTRHAGMRMMRVYLTPSSGAMSGAMVDASHLTAAKVLQWLLAWTPAPRARYVAEAYRYVPEFVSQLCEPDQDGEVLGNTDERLRMALEVAAVEALDALLRLGPLARAGGGAEAVQRIALDFLQMMALRGPHLRKPVERGLASFLHSQPMFCGHFFKLTVVDYSYDALGLTKPAAELLASIQLAALVGTWAGDLPRWLHLHNVPLARMLLVCLLHQCSPDAASRAAALELARELARNDSQPLDAGSALLASEFVTLSSCVAATYKYSQVLAAQCSDVLSEPLLRELASTARLLPDVQNESMLHMVMPWVAHFGEVFADSAAGEWRETWMAFLNHLLHLSYQCHARANSSFLFFTLEACWTAVLQAKPSVFLSELTIRFLVEAHARATSSMLQAAEAKTRGEGYHIRKQGEGIEGSDERRQPGQYANVIDSEQQGGVVGIKEDASMAQLAAHLCTRIVVFIGNGGEPKLMMAQLLEELPSYGLDEVPSTDRASEMMVRLSQLAVTGTAVEAAPVDEEKTLHEVSAFVLASELLLANIEVLAEHVPHMVHLALVHFGPGAAMHATHPTVGAELLAKLLAKLTPLDKEKRAALKTALGRLPSDEAQREALVVALCELRTPADCRENDEDEPTRSEISEISEISAALSLREGWAAICLSWALACPYQASVARALLWHRALTSHRQLAHAETFKLVSFLAVSLGARRAEAARATLVYLHDHTVRQNSIPYKDGVLLSVAGVLGLNTAKVADFTTALSLVHAALDRTPAGDASELSAMQLVQRTPPLPPAVLAGVCSPFDSLEAHRFPTSSRSPFPYTLDDHAKADAAPGWKSCMLQEALDAQLGLWQRRLGGQPPSADGLLRLLTLRGGALPACRDDAIWLISELRAIYQPHLPQCDEMAISLLWLRLLQACTSPRTSTGDAACERAVAWLSTRGADYLPLREHFEALHSSRQPTGTMMGAQLGAKLGAKLAWATAGVTNQDNEADAWWQQPLAAYLSSLRRLYHEREQQRRAFSAMLEACCQWLMLGQPGSLPASPPTTAAKSDTAGAAVTPEDLTNLTNLASAERWAALCMLQALLHEYRELWTLEQHAATASLLSSLVFVYSEPRAALKLRAAMQYLVTDPSSGQPPKLHFLHHLVGDPNAIGRRAVGVAAEVAHVFAQGRFPDHFHMQLLSEEEWTESFTALVLKLKPSAAEMGGVQPLAEVTPLAERLAAVTSLTSLTIATAPARSALPMRSGHLSISISRSHNPAAQRMAQKMALPPPPDGDGSDGDGALSGPSAGPYCAAAAAFQEVLAPPMIPGVARLRRGDSISALLPPPPPLPPLPGAVGPAGELGMRVWHQESCMPSTVAPPPILPGMVGGIAKSTPQLPQLPNSVAGFVAPPPPVLGAARGPYASVPPLLAGGRALNGSIASSLPPPPPRLATARHNTTCITSSNVISTPALANEPSNHGSDLGWSDDESNPHGDPLPRSGGASAATSMAHL